MLTCKCVMVASASRGTWWYRSHSPRHTPIFLTLCFPSLHELVMVLLLPRLSTPHPQHTYAGVYVHMCTQV